MKVLKFGGSSVADGAAIGRVAAIVSQACETSGHVVVVCSALRGVTDELIDLAKRAAAGGETWRAGLKSLDERHRGVMTALSPDRASGPDDDALQTLFEELEGVLRGFALLGEVSASTLDRAMSFGERLSNTLVAEVLVARGVSADYVDARELIRTDDRFGRARVDQETSFEQIRDRLGNARGASLVTGFIASTAEGVTTTLGRGGSDYTASLLAAALEADEIEIWTDVDGVMTANPRKVPLARPIRYLTYEEAMELSHFGAKVIYPPTLQPAFDRKIPIRVCNTFNPSAPGTWIRSANPPIGRAVKGLSSIEDISVLTVQGSGMVGVAGVSARLFGALARAKVNVIMITQASSEHSISIAVDPARAQAAHRAIEEEFAHELRARDINPVVVEPARSVIAVVGENMRHTPGIAAIVFAALARERVNVVAIAQGSSELNISIAVTRNDETKALRAIHDAFFREDTDEHRAEVYAVGAGVVGRAFLDQLAEQAGPLRETHALELRLCGVANSRRMAFDPNGLDLTRWRDDLERAQASDLESFLAAAAASPSVSKILVDCTAGDAVTRFYPDLLSAGLNVVTPNKLACSAPMDFYRMVHGSAAGRLAYETTVGAGLPIIGTIQDLLKSGDEILRIEAVLSGTVSYILDRTAAGAKLSEAVREAHEQGYSEPDPRADLEGLDVARKVLILARESGAEMELDEVDVQSVVPLGDRSWSVATFLDRLTEHDEAFAARQRQAEAQGRVLRYVGSFVASGGRVELREVDATSPFHQLMGTENMVIMTSRRYRTSPMVVRGPGAGAEVTAAGVLADVIRLARRRQSS